jgi:hypothetical protein
MHLFISDYSLFLVFKLFYVQQKSITIEHTALSLKLAPQLTLFQWMPTVSLTLLSSLCVAGRSFFYTATRGWERGRFQ